MSTTLLDAGECVSSRPASRTRQGLLYGFGAYGFWGIMPLYFKAVEGVDPQQLLGHRIVWSVVLLAILISAMGRWAEIRRAFRNGSIRTRLFVTSVLLALNWFAYIYSVDTHQLLQSTLGYFTTPLVNILLGRVLLAERLRRIQWIAVALAVAGVGYFMARNVSGFPWIALTVSVSFGLYGLLRKQTPVDGLIGLSVETMLLVPVSVGYLVWRAFAGESALGTRGIGFDVLILLSGAVTTFPLLCFGQAAQRLRLSTLGFMQYIAPSCQFVLAVTLFGEHFDDVYAVTFGLIWTALALYTLDALRVARRERV